MKTRRLGTKEKFDLLILEHHKLLTYVYNIFKLILSVGFIILVLLIMNVLSFGNNANNTSSSSVNSLQPILSPLLGVILGGIITYLINSRLALKSNRMKSSIENRRTIYEPLLIECKQFLMDIEKKDVLLIHSDSSHKNHYTTMIDVWTRIKNDARFYQLPSYLRTLYEILEDKISIYNKAKTNVQNGTYNFLIKILEGRNYNIDDNQRHMIMSILDLSKLIKRDNVIDNTNTSRIFLSIISVSQDDLANMSDEFNIYIKNTKTIDTFYKAKEELKNALLNCMNTLEFVVIRIIKDYERKNNIY